MIFKKFRNYLTIITTKGRKLLLTVVLIIFKSIFGNRFSSVYIECLENVRNNAAVAQLLPVTGEVFLGRSPWAPLRCTPQVFPLGVWMLSQ